MRRTWGRLEAGILVSVLYLAASAVAYWHNLGHPATWQTARGGGDPSQYDWFFGYTLWAIEHGHNPFVAHVINVPFGANLVGNTSMFLLGVLTAPITALWGPVASLNVLFFLSMPLSAGAGYLLARRLVSWRPAAFAGGLLYGFSPYMVGQGFGHLNLVFVPLPPLIMLVLYDLFVERRRSPLLMGVCLGVLVVAQFLISSEILATTALFSVIALVVVAIAARPADLGGRLRRVWPALAVAAVIAVVVLAWPVYDLFFGIQHLAGVVAGFRVYHATLAALLFPTPLLKLATAHMKAIGSRAGANNVENGVYLGLPLALFVILAGIFVRRRAARLLAVLVVIAYILSLGVRLYVGVARYDHLGRDIPLPAAVLYYVPLLNNAYPLRYALFTALFTALLLAVGLEYIAGRTVAAGVGRHSLLRSGDRSLGGGFRGPVIAAVVAVVCLVPLLPAWPYPAQGPVNTPPFFTTSDVDRLAPGTVTLVYPIPNNTEVQPMLWQAEARFRFSMVGGYFLIPVPGGTQYYQPTLVQATLTQLLTGSLQGGSLPAETPQLRVALVSDLASWGVRAVLVQPLPDARQFFTWLVGRPPDAAKGEMLEWYSVNWS